MSDTCMLLFNIYNRSYYLSSFTITGEVKVVFIFFEGFGGLGGGGGGGGGAAIIGGGGGGGGGGTINSSSCFSFALSFLITGGLNLALPFVCAWLT